MKSWTFFSFLFLLAFLGAASAAAQQVFVLHVNDDKGTLSNAGLELTEGYFYPPTGQPAAGYRLDMVSFDNSVLYSEHFSFDLTVKSEPLPEWFDANGNQIYYPTQAENTTTLESTTKEFILPYSQNAKAIHFFDANNTLQLSIDTTRYAKPCIADTACAPYESKSSCPEDCGTTLLPKGKNPSPEVPQPPVSQIPPASLESFEWLVLPTALIAVFLLGLFLLSKSFK